VVRQGHPAAVRAGAQHVLPHRLGWEIRRATPDAVLLGARGRLGLSGELLFARQQGALLFATFVRLDNALARTLWAAIEPRHRRGVRRLLERAAA
jgi:hypothetical protein